MQLLKSNLCCVWFKYFVYVFQTLLFVAIFDKKYSFEIIHYVFDWISALYARSPVLSLSSFKT